MFTNSSWLTKQIKNIQKRNVKLFPCHTRNSYSIFNAGNEDLSFYPHKNFHEALIWVFIYLFTFSLGNIKKIINVKVNKVKNRLLFET